MTLHDQLIRGIGIMVKIDDKRILGLELKTNDCILLFFMYLFTL